MGFGLDQQLIFLLQIWRAHFLEVFFQALQPFFDLAEIADHEVEFDILDVAQGIDRADMRDGGIFESAQDVDQRVHVAEMADVGGLLQRFLANGAHVHVFDGGVGEFLGVVESGQLVEALVGNFGHADMRLAGVRIRLFGEMRLGEDAKQRCLAYLGQADDAGFHGSGLRCRVSDVRNLTE